MNSPPKPKLTHVVIEAVSRQQRLFLAVFLAIVALAVLAILLVPKRYEATAQLIVEKLRPQSASSSSSPPGDKVAMSDDVTDVQVNSEMELLASQPVLRKAMGLPPVAADSDVQHMAKEQDALQGLRRRLTVDPVHRSSILDVTLAERTPQAAVDSLNSILNAYFEERARLAHSSGAAEFFAQQTDDFARKLAENRRMLSDFEIAHELVSMDDQKKIVETRIASLDDHIAEARARIANQQGRTRELTRKLETTPPRAETQRRSLTNQYAQARLQSTLVDLEGRRAEQLHHAEATDPAVVELDEKIEITRNALAEAGLHPAAENASDVNPLWQQIESLLLTASAEISGTAAEQAELIDQKHEAESRLRELLKSTGTYEDLSRHLTEVQSNYTLYAQKRDEARISDALETQKMFDVSLVQRPVATLVPTRPRPIPYLLTGLVLAFCLAMVAALLVDRTSDRVYSPQQLDTTTKMQTLATIPDDGDVRAPGAEVEYRKLLNTIRTAVLRNTTAEQDGRGHCVAVTSALDGEGVSTVVTSLAREAAKQGPQRIAMLDMDALSKLAVTGQPTRMLMRRDFTSWVWGMDAAAAAAYRAAPEPEEGAAKAEPMVENGVIDLGDLHGDRFWIGLDTMLVRAREEFDLVLLDCPSLRTSTLASELDGDVDGFVVVVGAGMERKRQVEQVGILLEQIGARLIGYVLNRRTYPVPGWLYGLFW